MALILEFAPGLRGLVEAFEGELPLALQHGEQAAFDLAPEDFELRVLIGAVGQSRFVHDAQPFQALPDLGGEHRRAVIGEERARQAALLNGLAEPVHEGLGRFGDIPL
jgi:hypothetical protein